MVFFTSRQICDGVTSGWQISDDLDPDLVKYNIYERGFETVQVLALKIIVDKVVVKSSKGYSLSFIACFNFGL